MSTELRRVKITWAGNCSSSSLTTWLQVQCEIGALHQSGLRSRGEWVSKWETLSTLLFKKIFYSLVLKVSIRSGRWRCMAFWNRQVYISLHLIFKNTLAVAIEHQKFFTRCHLSEESRRNFTSTLGPWSKPKSLVSLNQIDLLKILDFNTFIIFKNRPRSEHDW